MSSRSEQKPMRSWPSPTVYLPGATPSSCSSSVWSTYCDGKYSSKAMMPTSLGHGPRQLIGADPGILEEREEVLAPTVFDRPAAICIYKKRRRAEQPTWPTDQSQLTNNMRRYLVPQISGQSASGKHKHAPEPYLLSNGVSCTMSGEKKQPIRVRQSFLAREDVEKLLAAFIKDKGDAALQAALSLYNSTWEPTPSQENIKKTLVDIETDFLFLASTQAALKLHADNAKTGRTYSYLFSEPNQMAGIIRRYPSWMGADNTDDVPYVFGKPFPRPSHQDLSGYMIAYWTNFARTGTGQKFVELNSKMDESYRERI
ncbi:hypothetical protein F7725_015178 [Dissostichus mawsoni]|uniref:Carboxylesterase type B domain-containing protein n=1 Tax=Dissostichus mawsoni TaxID=36200 RepID=A0A7J5YI83_DISMA|nr:hypothetical protein F7725_015178 [Dissostichus mawsoni]